MKKQKYLRSRQNIFLFHFVTGLLFCIFFSNFLFDIGDQIKPFTPKENWKLKNPECQAIKDYKITFKNDKIVFWARSKAKSILSKFQIWRLFRLEYQGQLFKTDIRFTEHNIIYGKKINNEDVIHLNFDLDQVGFFNYTLYCLDEVLENGTFTVEQDPNIINERSKTLYFPNLTTVHVCQNMTGLVQFTYDSASYQPQIRKLIPNSIISTNKMEEEITLLDNYTYLPSCAVIEVFSDDISSIFTKNLFPAYKLSKINIPVGVNALNINNQLVSYIETVLQRKLIFIKSEIPPRYCWNNTIRYNSDVTPEEVDKSYFDEIRKRLVSFSLPLKEKIVTNAPKSRFSDFNIGFEMVSIEGMNFFDKIIQMIDAKIFVYFENDQDGFMLTYLPDDSVTYVINTYHSDADSKTVSFIKKSGRKIKFVELDQLKKTLENDVRNPS